MIPILCLHTFSQDDVAIQVVWDQLNIDEIAAYNRNNGDEIFKAKLSTFGVHGAVCDAFDFDDQIIIIYSMGSIPFLDKSIYSNLTGTGLILSWDRIRGKITWVSPLAGFPILNYISKTLCGYNLVFLYGDYLYHYDLRSGIQQMALNFEYPIMTKLYSAGKDVYVLDYKASIYRYNMETNNTQKLSNGLAYFEHPKRFYIIPSSNGLYVIDGKGWIFDAEGQFSNYVGSSYIKTIFYTDVENEVYLIGNSEIIKCLDGDVVERRNIDSLSIDGYQRVGNRDYFWGHLKLYDYTLMDIVYDGPNAVLWVSEGGIYVKGNSFIERFDLSNK